MTAWKLSHLTSNVPRASDPIREANQALDAGQGHRPGKPVPQRERDGYWFE
jgi:hypothetical protein